MPLLNAEECCVRKRVFKRPKTPPYERERGRARAIRILDYVRRAISHLRNGPLLIFLNIYRRGDGASCDVDEAGTRVAV